MPRQFTKRVLLHLTGFAILLVAIMPYAAGQETKSKETAAADKAADKEVEVEKESPFTVPDGTAEELFAFINKVKRIRFSGEGGREGVVEHYKEMIGSVIIACEKIREAKPTEEMELKAIREQLGALKGLTRYDAKVATSQMEALMKDLGSDTRPVIVALLKLQKMETQASKVTSMSAADRDVFLDEVFGVIAEDGLDRSTYSMVSTMGRSLGYGDDPEVAAKLYERLAAAMEQSDDEAMASRADKMLGSARRLRLPGNFMALEGTTAEGEEFDWKSYRGKVVLVDFWASWCGPCRAEIPNMKEQLEKYGDKDFAVVGINLDTTRKAYQKYVDDQELTWTNLMSDKKEEMGWNNPIVSQYGVSGIPTAILVDREGKVVSLRARGKELNLQLDKLLGSKDETSSETEAGDE